MVTSLHNGLVYEYKYLLKQYPRVNLKTQNISGSINIKTAAPAPDSETSLEDMSLFCYMQASLLGVDSICLWII